MDVNVYITLLKMGFAKENMADEVMKQVKMCVWIEVWSREESMKVWTLDAALQRCQWASQFKQIFSQTILTGL